MSFILKVLYQYWCEMVTLKLFVFYWIFRFWWLINIKDVQALWIHNILQEINNGTVILIFLRAFFFWHFSWFVLNPCRNVWVCPLFKNWMMSLKCYEVWFQFCNYVFLSSKYGSFIFFYGLSLIKHSFL